MTFAIEGRTLSARFGGDMIQVDAYTVGGMAHGTLTRAGHLREILEQTGELALQSVRWLPLGAS